MTESTKPRILVIDDDPDLQTLVRALFEHAGLDYIPALTAGVDVELLPDQAEPAEPAAPEGSEASAARLRLRRQAEV